MLRREERKIVYFVVLALCVWEIVFFVCLLGFSILIFISVNIFKATRMCALISYECENILVPFHFLSIIFFLAFNPNTLVHVLCPSKSRLHSDDHFYT